MGAIDARGGGDERGEKIKVREKAEERGDKRNRCEMKSVEKKGEEDYGDDDVRKGEKKLRERKEIN